MSSHPTDLRTLLAEEPFVRALAHSLLNDEADDVVQQTFLRALEHRPNVPVQPRRWLARVVRNLVTDRLRRRGRRDVRERAAAVTDRVPSPAELVEVEESRRTLVEAVNRLPQQLRTVVLLRYYEGLPPRRIAAALGLPVATVSEHLRVALRQLRARLDADHHGDRRAWLLPLVPVALQPRALPWRELLQAPVPAGLCTGVLAMMTKTKIVTTVATVLVFAGAWAVWPGTGAPMPAPQRDAAGGVAVAAQPMPIRTEVDAVPTQTPQREVVAATPKAAATTGSLEVRVRYADEPRPAADVPVILNRPGCDFRVGVVRGRTDANGSARFEALPAGSWEVTTGRAHAPTVCAIDAGRETECVLDLQRGMTVSGIVVDVTGTAVAGASIELGEPWRRDPEVIARSGADGTFALRACPSVSLIGARAEGYASSSLQNVVSFDGTPQNVRLELVAPGGIVEGLVVASDGKPVADAVVRIGEGRTDDLIAFTGSCPPLPALVRTDAEGTFRAIGLPVGTQPVQVRAVGFAPFRDSCEIAANLSVRLRVTLTEGARCAGTVFTEDGNPVQDVTVHVGQKGDFVQLFARTAADGSFELRDLPAGDVELSVADETHGKASASITAAPGAMAHCELRLSNGEELRGRVVDEADRPVTDIEVAVACEGTGDQREQRTRSDKEGRLQVRFLPPGCRVSIRVFGKLFDPVRKSGIDPAAGEVLLRVQNASRSAHIRGVVLGPDGKPAGNIGVEAHWQQTSGGTDVATAADGSFELGPLRTGGWRLRIIRKGCAWYHSPALTLAENATVDLGTIRLYRGGTLLANVTGAAPEQLDLRIYDDRGDLVFGMVSTNVPLRSLPLNPGGYDLRVRGNGLAAQRLPFTIRDGEETEVHVVVEPGTSQRLRFEVPAGDAGPQWFVFEVRRGGEVVLTGTSSRSSDFAAEHWLVPGDYEVVVTDYDLRGSARFTVGREPGPPVVVPVH
ncbi:MAG TPA: sigma-70 family RNA polymerase sigma factor [Planctomycetota bacterium]|nr:sigma-70 family RNA polymerase sigma factor [Planctomycetota bacterium]